MSEFVSKMLEITVLKCSKVTITRIVKDKEFLKNDYFETEDQAILYPTPLFCYYFLKTLFQTNGTTSNIEAYQLQISNSVSVLISLALSLAGREDLKLARKFTKYLTLAAYILTTVRASLATDSNHNGPEIKGKGVLNRNNAETIGAELCNRCEVLIQLYKIYNKKEWKKVEECEQVKLLLEINYEYKLINEHL